jgi:hypothetical protein
VGPIFVAAISLALFLPFADLDPARGVTASLSPFTDEGANVVNARNLVLFGSWTTDAWSLHLLNGPFSLLEAAVFRVLGIGLVQARLVAIMSVAVSAGLLASLVARSAGRAAGFIAALAYATSALTLYYGRLAYVEPLAGLFLLIGLLTLSTASMDSSGSVPHGARRATIARGAVGGVAFAAAVATKAVVAPAVLAAFVAVALLGLRQGAVRSWLVGAISGLAAAAVVWLLVVWVPYAADVTAMFEHVLPREGLDLSVPGLAHAAGYFAGRGDDTAVVWSLPLLLGALAGAGLQLVRSVRSSSAPAPLYLAAAAALGGGLMALALVQYHPNRYIVPLLPVAAILVAPAAGAVLGRLTAIGAARRGSQALRTATVGLLIATLAAPGVIAYARWTADATRELPAAQAAAVRDIPSGAIVVGHYAPIVALDTQAVTIIPCCGSDPVNGGDLYTERGARYLIRGADPIAWTPAPPAAIAAAQTIFCLTWGQPTARTCLVQLP